MSSTNDLTKLISTTKRLVLSAISTTLAKELRHLIDDVAQETYFKAYKHLKKNNFESVNSLESYMYTIAKNEANRMNKKEITLINTYRALANSPPQTASPNHDEKHYLGQLINELTSPTKEILTLFKDGYSLTEISEKLDIKLNAVKSRVLRGKKSLQKLAKGAI